MTALLLPAAFPSAPVDPLTWLTAPPYRAEQHFTYAAGEVDADIYHPASPGPHGGAILLLGARPVPRRDPTLVKFAEALARTGVVVLVPESSSLLAGRIVPEEEEALQESFDLLESQPDVDAHRTGFIGFSVGGGLSVVAAARVAIRDRVEFVNTLGGYYDAQTLLVDVASRSILVDGTTVQWEPSPLTREVFAQQVVDTLPLASDQALLRRAFVEHAEVTEPEWGGLSPVGQEARALLQGTTREDAERILAAMPAALHDRLAAISPSAHLQDVHARLYLMHDRGDAFIPYTQTRALAAHAAPSQVQRYTEFTIFEHVIPDRPVPVAEFLPDLWALYWHLDAVLLELL